MPSLKDFVNETYYRGNPAQGYADQANPLGPVDSPTVQGREGNTVEDLLQQLIGIMQRNPFDVFNEARKRFLNPVPREAVSFIVPSGEVNAVAGATTTVCSLTMAEKYAGALTHIMANVIPSGMAGSITWSLQVGTNSKHPGYSQLTFAPGSLAVPLPFPFELLQSRTYILTATNSNALDISVTGALIGWTEYMAQFKEFGGSSASGIS